MEYKIINAEILNEMANRLSGCAGLLDACIDHFADETTSSRFAVVSDALTDAVQNLSKYVSGAETYAPESQKEESEDVPFSDSELRHSQPISSLAAYKTCELVEELKGREGVYAQYIAPLRENEIQNKQPGDRADRDGLVQKESNNDRQNKVSG